MGGRGAGSNIKSNSVIQNGSIQKIVINEDVVIGGHVNSDNFITGGGYVSSNDYSVVEASFDKKSGVLTLEESKNYDYSYKTLKKYFKPKSSYSKGYNKEYDVYTRTYKVKNGLIKGIETGGFTKSINLNINNAKIIKGDTYDHKDYIKNHGFTWNSQNKYWEKK